MQFRFLLNVVTFLLTFPFILVFSPAVGSFHLFIFIRRAVKMMLLEKCANPNYLLPMRGISPLHLSIGIDPYNFAFDSTKLILENGGNPNVR